jgi:hypothetical protein
LIGMLLINDRHHHEAKLSIFARPSYTSATTK